jgi:superfamily II DNA/RNA helicase
VALWRIGPALIWKDREPSQKFVLHPGANITTHASHTVEMAPQTKIDRSFGALTPALSEWIIEAVDAMGFVKTTPVQHAAIPMFMKNSDVVVEAVTGSGKTLAYVLFNIHSLALTL